MSGKPQYGLDSDTFSLYMDSENLNSVYDIDINET